MKNLSISEINEIQKLSSLLLFLKMSVIYDNLCKLNEVSIEWMETLAKNESNEKYPRSFQLTRILSDRTCS